MKKMKSCLGFEWCPFLILYIKHIKIKMNSINIKKLSKINHLGLIVSSL